MSASPIDHGFAITTEDARCDVVRNAVVELKRVREHLLTSAFDLAALRPLRVGQATLETARRRGDARLLRGLGYLEIDALLLSYDAAQRSIDALVGDGRGASTADAYAPPAFWA